MPGTGLAVRVAHGDGVRPGQPLLVVEAMNMEHTVVAPVGGRVVELLAQADIQVVLDQVLAVIQARDNGTLEGDR
jgi:acetyl-CoA/propionyl-CoA carboxylase, biotin carboxylase, biotin carboxyl carrier protein